jgi:FMN phosphatase YigB (HAD superfamily)
MHRSVDTVFFDVGNVLVEFSIQRSCQALARHTGRSVEELHETYLRPEWVYPLETGLLSGRMFYDILARDLGFTESATYEVFAEWMGDIFLDPPLAVLDAIKGLRHGVHKYLTSNTMELHWNYLERLPSVRLFSPQEYIRSYDPDVQARKPSKKFFESALARAHVRPEQVLYIDDLAENLSMFAAMGGKTARFSLLEHEAIRLRQILDSYDLTTRKLVL